MASHNQYQRTVPFILFVFALILLFLLVRPVITILLSSVLLAYIAFPLYKKIFKKIPYKTFSLILSLLIIVIIIAIPFSFLAFDIIQQGYYFYNSMSGTAEKGALFGFGCTSIESELCLLVNQAEKFSLEQLSKIGFDRQIQNLLPVIEKKITTFILRIPIIIAEIFLVLIIAYFIMLTWKDILKKIVELLPMRKKTITRLVREFGAITHTVIYAQLFVALVQGIVGGLGFYLLGVPFPIIFGVLVAFCSLIPTIGTSIIWLPASIFLILSGYFSHNYGIVVKGIILFFYGLFVISTIDNILMATIVHAKAKVNQILVIIGVIGGGVMFGVAGIFIGPILLPLLITYFRTFKERFR